MSRAAESTPDPADDATPSTDATYVGVSTGTDTLLAAASAQPTLGTEFSVDAAHVRERAAHLSATTGAWLPTAARQAVTDRAREAGIPVVRVAAPERCTDCHQCGATGSVTDGELSCPDESCPVDRVARGQNAAVHLARRGARG